MTPTVFLYVVLFTALVAGAAAAVEWAAQGRMGVRHFWSAVIVLALIAPPLAIAWATLAKSDPSAAFQRQTEAVPIIVRSSAAVTWATGIVSLPTALTDTNGAMTRGASVVWVLASLGLFGWILLGMWRWKRARRAWRRTMLDGVSVEVSPATGPAVLGIVSQAIVLPAWATELPVERRRLMLAHECEHITARDPQRLALAAAALILMPWNVALWWCVARLRRAIELDCDARVLRRFPNAKEYGYLLLEVAERGRHPGALAIPLIGLLRVPSELELRLRAITRPSPVARRVLAGGVTAAFIAVAAAFTTPVPRIAVGAHTPNAPAAQRVAFGVGTTDVTVNPDRRGTPVRMQVDRLVLREPGSQTLKIDIRDTVPPTRRDSLARLQRKIDSLRARSLQLQEMRRDLDARNARLDTAQAWLRAQQEQIRIGRSPTPNQQTTYFDFQTDSSATQKPESSSPQYPAALRAARVSGEVDARFVVGVDGMADMTTFQVIRATDPAFASAVRIALPRMQFNAAKIRNVPVRQLVQQPFIFQITDSVPRARP